MRDYTMTNAHMNPRDIELHLTSSRETLELGEPWEILLYVHNHSEFIVWIVDLTTTLTLPAELIHPGESNVGSRGAQLPTVSGPGSDMVSIPPGGQYMCSWRINQDAREMDETVSKWDIFRWHMFFHPATYSIQAHIHVWTERPDPEVLATPRMIQIRHESQKQRLSVQEIIAEQSDEINADEHSASKDIDTEALASHSSQTTTRSFPDEEDFETSMFPIKKLQADAMAGSLPLTAAGHIDVTIKSTSQFVAAALGGVLAFLFRESYALSSNTAPLQLQDIGLLPTYVLSAVLISLLVSRVTEARFPLTVKIMDFWGATAFGVLAAFAGAALLSRVLMFLI